MYQLRHINFIPVIVEIIARRRPLSGKLPIDPKLIAVVCRQPQQHLFFVSPEEYRCTHQHVQVLQGFRMAVLLCQRLVFPVEYRERRKIPEFLRLNPAAVKGHDDSSFRKKRRGAAFKTAAPPLR